MKIKRTNSGDHEFIELVKQLNKENICSPTRNLAIVSSNRIKDSLEKGYNYLNSLKLTD